MSSIGAKPLAMLIGKRKFPFALKRVDELFASATSESRLQFQLGRDEPPRVWFQFVMFPGAPDGRGIAVRSYMPWEMLENVGTAERFARGIGSAFAAYEVIAGHCHSFADIVAAYGDRDSSSWDPTTVDEVFWLNWYGSSLVERLGRACVLTVPAEWRQELPDGSVLWTTRPGPADFASDVARHAQARARAHLVHDLDDQNELARLLERSRQIAAVEPAWGPELDAVFSLISNADSSPQAIRELNALEIPAVDEYRHATSVTSNIDDPGTMIDEYAMHAEHLIALLHDKVENIGTFDPSELPKLDAHFWRYKYPERFDAEEVQGNLVPAVGGYIGELLVRRFGGRWVPRENIDEAAVVIGDRAWLPFARARKYLARREGAVRASTTKFVREIERHRSQP